MSLWRNRKKQNNLLKTNEKYLSGIVPLKQTMPLSNEIYQHQEVETGITIE